MISLISVTKTVNRATLLEDLGNSFALQMEGGRAIRQLTKNVKQSLYHVATSLNWHSEKELLIQLYRINEVNHCRHNRKQIPPIDLQITSTTVVMINHYTGADEAQQW